MRLRLIHTVSLILVSSAFLAVLTMGAVNAWNLRNGFLDYLLARDVATLDVISRDVSELASKAGGIEKLIAMRIPLNELLRALGELKRSQGPSDFRRLSFADFQSFMVQRNLKNPSPMEGGSESYLQPGQKPDRWHYSEDATPRVAIYSNSGHLLLGRSLAESEDDHIERALVINGKSTAVLRMNKRLSFPDSRETNFLAHQFVNIVVVACVFFLLSLVCAKRLARYWVAPLLDLQKATERIARGELDVRLNEQRSDEIGDAMRNINQMAQGLQRMDDSRRQWIADISHELRTPLAVLRGEIDALIDGVRPLTPNAIESLREEALRLGSLVDDLHLLSMADLKALPCYFEDIEAQGLLKKTLHRFVLKASQRGLQLKLQTLPSEPVIVRWDIRRIEQLLSNLLENSLRYTDAPGEVKLGMVAYIDHIAIDIEDSAPGVSKDEMLKLFEPLYRVDAARSRDSGGSGLGLAICKAIVQAHRGSITAGSSEMGGLRVHIELPYSAEVSA